MSAISSLSSFLQNLSLVQNSQSQIAKLTYQVDTGLKSQDLQGYGTQANQLLNLKSAQTTEQNYVSNNTQTQTILSAYDATLGQVKTDATSLSASLNAFSATDTISSTNLKTLVNSLSVDIAATLNSQVGGRYLYGGTRYTTAPVGDLTGYLNNVNNVPSFVSPATTPPTVTPLTVTDGKTVPGTLPSPQTSPPTILVPGYDSQASTLNASAIPSATTVAAATQTVTSQTTAIANNQTTSYGVSSNDPTFQHLVYALQNALAAANISPMTPALQSQQQAYLDQAKSEIGIVLNGVTAVTASAGPPAVTAVAGVTGIQSLQDQNGLTQSAVANANTVHNQTLATLDSQITSIDQVDPATVAAELTAAQNQLAGSYKVVSSVLNDTLLNYLK
ncbi:MAG: hypothetical protein JWO51_3277 [Rhodospirillales bacterium]|nr:hypothetical protein [Rhodospirillales bacterium]